MIDGLEVGGGGDGSSSRLMRMRLRVSAAAAARRVLRWSRAEAAAGVLRVVVVLMVMVWRRGGVIRCGNVERCRIEWVGIGSERA